MWRRVLLNPPALLHFQEVTRHGKQHSDTIMLLSSCHFALAWGKIEGKLGKGISRNKTESPRV